MENTLHEAPHGTQCNPCSSWNVQCDAIGCTMVARLLRCVHHGAPLYAMGHTMVCHGRCHCVPRGVPNYNSSERHPSDEAGPDSMYSMTY